MSILAELRKVIEARETLTLPQARTLMQAILRGEASEVELAGLQAEPNWQRADVLLARKEARADYCFEKAVLLAPHDWFIAWLGSRVRRYYKQFVLALKLLQQAVELNPGNFVLWLEQGRFPLTPSISDVLGLEAGHGAVNFYVYDTETNVDAVT